MTFSKDGGTLDVALLGAPDELGTGAGPYALVTYAAANPVACHVRNPWPGSGLSREFTETDNGDGTKTLKVTLRPCGMRFIVR